MGLVRDSAEWAVRMLGFVLCCVALLFAALSMLVRFDSWDGVREATVAGVATGAVLALGVFLFAAPPVGHWTRRWWALTAATACCAGAVVAGGLALRHYIEYLCCSWHP
jgi:hypothetical protein